MEKIDITENVGGSARVEKNNRILIREIAEKVNEIIEWINDRYDKTKLLD